VAKGVLEEGELTRTGDRKIHCDSALEKTGVSARERAYPTLSEVEGGGGYQGPPAGVMEGGGSTRLGVENHCDRFAGGR